MTVELIKINRDKNGNPRYICHFTDVLSDVELFNANLKNLANYKIALKKAKAIGGKRYDTKKHPFCIVFQSYNKTSLANDIVKLRFENI